MTPTASNSLYTILTFSITSALLYIFMCAIIIVNICIALSSDLIKSILLMSISSVIICLCYLLLDAPDVAMTEASLGACISTVIFLKIIPTLQTSFSNATRPPKYKTIFYGIVCTLLAITLAVICWQLPEFGQTDAVMHQHVSKYYIDHTVQDIGIPSFVASILASYRGYDTLGETTVILCAGVSAILIFANNKSSSNRNIEIMTNISNNPIFTTIIKIIIPYIILFGLYIQVNGEVSPGGGFQAGAILASAVIGYDMSYPQSLIKYRSSTLALAVVAAIGVLIYGATGLIALYKGKHFLNYDAIIPGTSSQSLGISIIELGVGLTVMSSLLIIYYMFIIKNYNDVK